MESPFCTNNPNRYATVGEKCAQGQFPCSAYPFLPTKQPSSSAEKTHSPVLLRESLSSEDLPLQKGCPNHFLHIRLITSPKGEKNNKRVCLLVSFSLQFLPSLSHFQTQVSALLCPSCLKCVLTLSAPDSRVRPPCLRCNGSSVPYSQTATCVPLTDEGLCVCVASDTRCPRYWKIIIRFVCVCVYFPDNHSGRACWYSSVVPGVTGSRITAQEITIILSPKCTQASTCTPVFGERANNANNTLIFLIRQKWHLGLGCKSDLLYYLKQEPNPI